LKKIDRVEPSKPSVVVTLELLERLKKGRVEEEEDKESEKIKQRRAEREEKRRAEEEAQAPLKEAERAVLKLKGSCPKDFDQSGLNSSSLSDAKNHVVTVTKVFKELNDVLAELSAKKDDKGVLGAEEFEEAENKYERAKTLVSLIDEEAHAVYESLQSIEKKKDKKFKPFKELFNLQYTQIYEVSQPILDQWADLEKNYEKVKGMVSYARKSASPLSRPPKADPKHSKKASAAHKAAAEGLVEIQARGGADADLDLSSQDFLTGEKGAPASSAAGTPAKRGRSAGASATSTPAKRSKGSASPANKAPLEQQHESPESDDEAPPAMGGPASAWVEFDEAPPPAPNKSPKGKGKAPPKTKGKGKGRCLGSSNDEGRSEV